MTKRYRSTITLLLFYSTIFTPVAATAQEASLVNFVYDEAVFAAIARPRRVLTSPRMKMLPIEVISAAGKGNLGVDPVEVEEILVAVQPPTQGPPSGGVVVLFSKPFSLDMLPPQLLASTELAQHDGMMVRKAADENPTAPWFAMVNDRTLIIAMQPAFDEMIQQSKTGKRSTLGDKLIQNNEADVKAVLEYEKIRPLANMMLSQAPPVPPPYEALNEIPKLATEIELSLILTASQKLSMTMKANNDAECQRIESIVADSFQAAQAQLQTEFKNNASHDPVELAGQQYMMRLMKTMFDQVRPTRNGNTLTVAVEGGQNAELATIGVLVALLLPAIQAAREAARRAQAINQIKQIAIAMHNYESANGQFPARANFDKNDKALLSWRVHLLPFLEEDQLYREFKLDESWNSEHNRKLIDRMPGIYTNPNLDSPSRTNFLAVSGEGTVFEGSQATKLKNIKDGLSKTLMLVEADDAVIWTQPEDLVVDFDNPFRGLGTFRNGGFVAGLADASVQFISNSFDKNRLKALFTRAGNDLAD